MQTLSPSDGLAVLFKAAVRVVAEDAVAEDQGEPRTRRALLTRLANLVRMATRHPREAPPIFADMTARYEHTLAEQEREIAALNARFAGEHQPEVPRSDGGSTWPPCEADLGP